MRVFHIFDHLYGNSLLKKIPLPLSIMLGEARGRNNHKKMALVRWQSAGVKARIKNNNFTIFYNSKSGMT